MRGADVYYGDKASRYDAERSGKPKWKAEQAALGEFLTDGPVLDVPFGTGRFVPIYDAKGIDYTGVEISADMVTAALEKYPDANVRLGSVFELDARQEFATAVCVRFLEWWPLEASVGVMSILRAVADTLIVTINHGVEGEPEAFTYDLGKFMNRLDGLFIAGRRVTARIPGTTSEMFKLRSARWSDVLDQFPNGDIQRVAYKHAELLGVSPMLVTRETVGVRAEYWSGEEIGELLRSLPAGFSTTARPRRDSGPLTILDRGDVRMLLDGRHRANFWKSEDGPHPVLVLKPRGA